MALALASGLSVGAAAPAPGPQIIGVRLVGEATEGLPALLDELLGQRDGEKTFVAWVRRAEEVAGVGTLDVLSQAVDATRDARARVVVLHDPTPRRVSNVAFVIDGAAMDAEAAWRLWRRIDADEGLESQAGRRHHPYLVGVDRRAIQAWYQDQGFREAGVTVDVKVDGGLVDVTWQVQRGPRYLIETVDYSALPERFRGPAARATEARPGQPPSASRVRRDENAVRDVLCQAGFPRAEAHVAELVGPVSPEGGRPVTLRFIADVGPFVRTGPVQVAGRLVPRFLLQTLPLQEGQPFCPSQVEATRDILRDFLKDNGVPDPRIVVEARTWLKADGRRVQAVTFDIRQLADARVERIWFGGNLVTQPAILRQLLAIAEGDLYRQTAVDASVQAMRRSGLFQKVDVDIIAGSAPDRVHLRFRVQERKVFRVDVSSRTLTLYNMDVGAWPGDMRDVEHGHAFRGGGQRLDLLGDTSNFGVKWRDDFLTRLLVARASAVRSTASNAAFEEQWINLDAGLGLKAAEGALIGVLFGQVEWTRSERDKSAGAVVLDGDTLTGAVGFDGRMDFTRRDDERIQYLGLELSTVVRAGTDLAGESVRWLDDTTRLRLHLPLWQTRRRQHWVLRLTARNRGVFAATADGSLQGHQRLFPSARGYSGSSIGVEFPGAEGDAVLLGGLHAVDGSAEIRIPLPFGRRNAIAPFVDAAAVSDDVKALFQLEDVKTSAGLAVTFSLFDERIEGSVWGAWPLDPDADAEYVGGSFGGSF
ncbi:MAG: BamA/TamA family outer membrane protein [Myxococcales bacterium]|nr:BamA/TamA family outer membrane protein [Myxococcales bacterium]